MKKILLCMVLGLCLLAVLLPTVAIAGGTPWDGTIPSAVPNCTFSGGNGTSVNPYLISTAADLAQLSANVESGMNYKDMYLKIQNDIALNSDTSKHQWDPIGSYKQLTDDNYGLVWDIATQSYKQGVINDPRRPFSGTFDGGGYTVSGLYINTTESSQSLFVYNTGTIKNLTVAGEITAGQFIGGVTSNNGGTLSHCKNAVNINAEIYIGGISGDSGGIIEYCENTGSITGRMCGGITGGNGGKVVGCNNSGSVSGGATCGGVVGENNNGAMVTNSYNSGSVTGYGLAGGVVGQNYSFNKTTTVQLCYNTGSVSANKVGGVVGEMSNSNETNVAVNIVQHCYNTGNVTTPNISPVIAAGVIGSILIPTGTCTIQDCYNAGSVTTQRYGYDSYDGEGSYNDHMASGVIGTSNISSAQTCIIQNCYYDKQMCPVAKAIGSGSESASVLGKLTTEMTGTLLSGSLDANSWIFADGLYPRLVNMDATNGAYVSAAPIFLDSSDTLAAVTKNFTVSTANGVNWSSTNQAVVAISSNDAALLSSGDDLVLTVSLNGTKKTVPIASVTAPVYALSVQSHVYDGDPFGYTQLDTTSSFSIRNNGDTEITISSVGLSGTDASVFVLNKTTGMTLPSSAQDYSYTIQPQAGLLPGKYYAMLTVTYNNNAKVNATVCFWVTNASLPAPAAPTLSDRTATSISLNTISDAEYKKNGTDWQDSPIFRDLEPETSYTFYARLKAKTNYDASASSSAVLATLAETAKAFTITWIVGGKTVTRAYDFGETPKFTGSTTKPTDTQYMYTFAGWSPSISTVTKDATYTAQYARTAHGLPASFFKAYVCNTETDSESASGRVDVLDLTNNTIEKEKITFEKLARSAEINSNGQLVLITNSGWGKNYFSLINPVTDAVINRIELNKEPLDVEFNKDGSLAYVAMYVWVSGRFVNRIDVIDTTFFVTTKEIVVGSTGIISMQRVGDFLYLACEDNTVKVVDLVSQEITDSISVGRGPRGISANPAGTKLYVSNYSDDTVSVINVASNTVVATISVEDGPESTEVTPDGKYIYVACRWSKHVVVVDAALGEIKTVIEVGQYPNSIGISPDGNYAYCLNVGGRSISIIDTQTYMVVDTLATSKWPTGTFMATTYSVAEFTVKAAIAGAREALDEADFTYASGENKDNVKSNITIPLTGENDTDITWKEKTDTGSNIVIWGNLMTVSRPSITASDQIVVITATISKAGGTSKTKDLTLIIKAITATEVADAAIAGALAALDETDLTYASGENKDNVKSNITIPLTGENNTTISWKAKTDTGNNIAVAGSLLTISRPSITAGDKTVVITATISKADGTSKSKDFTLVIKVITAAEEVDAAIAGALKALDETDFTYASGENKDNVKSNVTVPLTGENGTIISWAENPIYIDHIKISGGLITVTRGYSSNQTVRIIATISKPGGTSQTKELTLEIKGITVAEKADAAIAGALAALDETKLSYKSGENKDNVKSTIVELLTGANNTTISWAEKTDPGDNIEVFNSPLTTAFRVTRPAPTAGDQTVVITATISKEGGTSQSKDFTLVIKAFTVDEANAAIAADLSALGEYRFIYAADDNLNSVKSNVTIPLTGVKGSSISWAEKTDPGNNIEISGNLITVTRPAATAGDKKVSITASISIEGCSSKTKDLNLVIKAFEGIVYTVIYAGNGSTGGEVPTAPTLYADGDVVTVAVAGNLLKTGYSFTGWNTRADGTGTSYAAGASFSIDKSQTLYAQWSIMTKFEAEAAILYKTQIESGNLAEGASGNSHVGWFDPGAGATGWGYNVEFTGLPAGNNVLFKYAALNAGFIDIYQNGKYLKPLNFEATGGWRGIGNYATVSMDIAIQAGDSLQVFFNQGNTTLNLDYIEVRTVGKVTWSVAGRIITETYACGTMPEFKGSTDKTANAQYSYTFTGWDKGISAVTGDVTYTAQYSATVNQYTVTWSVDGKTTTATYAYGTTPEFKGSTDKAADAQHSYTFTGWNKTITAIIGDVTYTAQYTTTGQKYTVTYNGNGFTGGNVPTDSTGYTEGDTVTATKPGDLMKTGLCFNGWNTKADGTGTAYAAGATFETGTADVTLYAQWVASTKYEAEAATLYGNTKKETSASASGGEHVGFINATGNYVKFENLSAGNSVSFTYAAQSGGAISIYKNNTNVTDFFFSGTGGWTTYATASIKVDIQAGDSLAVKFDSGDSALNLDYIEVLTVNQYTVTWSVDGKTSTASYAYGATPAFSGSTDKAADAQYTYTFTGWDKPISAVTGNVTYTAQYLTNDYGISFKAVSRISNTAATVQFISSKAGQYYYKVVGDGAAKPTIATTEMVTACIASENTLDLSNLSAGPWDIYIQAKDAAGNVSSMLQIDIPAMLNTATYDGNGNTGGTAPLDSTGYAEGGTVTAAQAGNLVKTGLCFNGWNIRADGTGTAYAAGATFAMGEANVTLYAQWVTGTKYEAENATIHYATIETISSASGGKQVGSIHQIGSYVEFANLPAGDRVNFIYATTYTGTISIYKNDTHVWDLSFGSTGGWSGSGHYATASLDIDIQVGDRLKVQYDSGDTALNLDYIELIEANPVVSGVLNGKIYASSLSPTFNKGTAKLDGVGGYISGAEISTEGHHVLVVTDAAGKSTTVKFIINKTALEDKIAAQKVAGAKHIRFIGSVGSLYYDEVGFVFSNTNSNPSSGDPNSRKISFGAVYDQINHSDGSNGVYCLSDFYSDTSPTIANAKHMFGFTLKNIPEEYFTDPSRTLYIRIYYTIGDLTAPGTVYAIHPANL